MIGSITPGNSYGYTGTGQSLPRGGNDFARTTVSVPEKGNETPADRTEQSPQGRAELSAEAVPLRRVEARQAAEDVRLEPFRADEMPLQTAKALSVFAAVSASADDSTQSGTLAGIDLIV